ncbi:MAG: hypothetical protein AAF688_09415, partial [Bacteroidota bacterium]
MITKKILRISKIYWIFFLTIGLTFQINGQAPNDKSTVESDDINITIDANTTDKNFEEIKAMLAEYNIEAKFSNIKRNENTEITGIKIKLSSGGSQTSSQRSSYQPIYKLSLGRKDGSLYIGEDNGLPNMLSMLGGRGSIENFFENDSLFSGFSGFDANTLFNDPNSMFLFNGDSLTIDQIRDRMMQNFNFKNSLSDRFSYLFDDGYDDGQQKYQFRDDPNLNKIIVIDGEISDFETLSKLADEDKLDSVDNLSPKAAISIYGQKGKDGA